MKQKVLFCIFALPCLVAAQTYTQKQVLHVYAPPAVSGAWTNPLTNGSLIACWGSGTAASPSLSIGDTVNTYSSRVGPATDSSTVWEYAFYAINTSTSALTVTFSNVTASSDFGFTCVEYTSSLGWPALASVVDAQDVNHPAIATTTIGSAAFNTTATDLIVMGWGDENTALDSGTATVQSINGVSGSHIHTDTSHFDGQIQWLAVPSGSGYTATFTSVGGSASNWGAITWAFKSASPVTSHNAIPVVF